MKWEKQEKTQINNNMISLSIISWKQDLSLKNVGAMNEQIFLLF